MNQKNRFVPFADRDWTVAAYLDYWMRDIHSKNIRANTKTAYSVMIERHIKPTMGNHKLRDLSVYNLRCALNAMEERGDSPRIQLECLRVISVCLNYAMSEEGGELVSRNVARLVKKPKYAPKEIEIWTPEQAIVFLESIKNHPLYIAFLLIMVYGLRRGEAVGLRWNCIDFESNTIHVRQQINRINGKLEACSLKTEKSSRDLPIMTYVRNALLEQAEKNDVVITPYNPADTALSTDGTVVVSESGTPLEPQNLLRSFHLLAKKASLPRIKLHALRHLAATMLKDLNVPIKDAQLILGHSDSATTLKFYQHGTEETICSAIARMENRLIGG